MFKADNKDYYEPIRIGNAFSNNYIEYEINGDKDKTLSGKEYFNKIKPYLGMMINVLKNQGEQKIQLTIAANLFFFQRF